MEHNKAPHGFAQLVVYGDIRELTLTVGFILSPNRQAEPGLNFGNQL
jgi:hypothetical protein